MALPSKKFIQGLQLRWMIVRLSRLLGIFMLAVFAINSLAATPGETVKDTLSGTLFWVVLVGWPLIILWVLCLVGLIFQRVSAKSATPKS